MKFRLVVKCNMEEVSSDESGRRWADMVDPQGSRKPERVPAEVIVKVPEEYFEEVLGIFRSVSKRYQISGRFARGATTKQPFTWVVWVPSKSEKSESDSSDSESKSKFDVSFKVSSQDAFSKLTALLGSVDKVKQMSVKEQKAYGVFKCKEVTLKFCVYIKLPEQSEQESEGEKEESKDKGEKKSKDKGEKKSKDKKEKKSKGAKEESEDEGEKKSKDKKEKKSKDKKEKKSKDKE